MKHSSLYDRFCFLAEFFTEKCLLQAENIKVYTQKVVRVYTFVIIDIVKCFRRLFKSLKYAG